jgi:hypothetical protein
VGGSSAVTLFGQFWLGWAGSSTPTPDSWDQLQHRLWFALLGGWPSTWLMLRSSQAQVAGKAPQGHYYPRQYPRQSNPNWRLLYAHRRRRNLDCCHLVLGWEFLCTSTWNGPYLPSQSTQRLSTTPSHTRLSSNRRNGRELSGWRHGKGHTHVPVAVTTCSGDSHGLIPECRYSISSCSGKTRRVAGV